MYMHIPTQTMQKCDPFSAESQKNGIKVQNLPLKFRHSVTWSSYQIIHPPLI